MGKYLIKNNKYCLVPKFNISRFTRISWIWYKKIKKNKVNFKPKSHSSLLFFCLYLYIDLTISVCMNIRNQIQNSNLKSKIQIRYLNICGVQWCIFLYSHNTIPVPMFLRILHIELYLCDPLKFELKYNLLNGRHYFKNEL